jgi:NAD(P)-dependent dehydrogenase (short-subunit alcohol dehydrogenase family)
MRDVGGKVAVVTGAASGIGQALATRFARAGMNVVLADVEPDALAAAERALAGAGATVLAVRTDVSRAEDVDALARATVARFGTVDVVCNNAGVSLAGPVWEHTLEDWQWLLGVNLWGVVHGIRTFVPLMLAQKTEGHIVNTASVAGLTSVPGLGVYNVSKHAVVTLSETLAKDLALAGARIKVSVLCPGFVNTRILESDRNRPAALARGSERERPSEMGDVVRALIAAGMPPAEVAGHVFRAIEEERFYVLTHPDFAARVRERCEDILEGRTPQAWSITG